MPKQPNHNAFTMVELLAATALSAVLMLAVLGLTVSMNRTEAALKRIPMPLPEQARLIQLIRRDLMHAGTLHIESSDIVMTGFSAFDPKTLQTSHRPVQIRYSVRANDEASCLVRAQRFLDGPGDQKTFVQLVHWGVRRLDLQQPEKTDEASIADTQTEEKDDVDEVPPQIVLKVVFVDPKTPELEHLIVLR